jgi:tetratricopeptide (TPR) repeat protein
MSNDPNKKPKPNPDDSHPPVPNDAPGSHAQPDEEIGDLSEFEFAEILEDLSVEDGVLEVPEEPLEAEEVAEADSSGTVSFDYAPPTEDHATRGISLEDLAELGLGDFAVPGSEPEQIMDAVPASGVPLVPEAQPLSAVDIAAEQAEPISSIDLAEVAESAEPAGPASAIPIGAWAEGESGSTVPLVPDAQPGSAVLAAEAAPSSEVLAAEIVEDETSDHEPVMPASGWLDEDAPQPVDIDAAIVSPPLEVNQADLFEAAPVPAIESSDIFSSGHVPLATSTDYSDVIAATAYRAEAVEDEPEVPARPSDVALSFDQPPGGSTVHAADASADLPVAEEVVDSSEHLFEEAEPVTEFDSAKLAETPRLPETRDQKHDERPDFGATPFATPDASSILADLSEPGETAFEESSSIRLDAPGVGRTHGTGSDEGTEFDLTIMDDAAPPELAAAAADVDDADDEPTDWRQQSSSDLFADGATTHELDLDFDNESSGQVHPIADLLSDDPSLTSAPSSIFTGSKLPGTGGKPGGPSSDSVRIGRPPEEEDAAVEFSYNPTADPESSSAALLGSPTPMPGARPPSAKLPPATNKPAAEDEDSGRLDWFAVPGEEPDQATMGFPHAALDAPLSGILKHGIPAAPTDETRASPLGKGKPTPKKPVKESSAPAVPLASDPSVEIDWMAGSSAETPAVAADVEDKVKPDGKKDKKKGKAPEKPKGKERPVREPALAGKGRGGAWLGGTFLGMLVAGGACAGAYFAGLVPNGQTAAIQQPTGPKANELPLGPGPNIPGSTPAVTVADATNAMAAGDHAKAVQVFDTLKTTTPDKLTTTVKAASGQARLFARVHALGQASARVNDPELQLAREDLQAVVDDAALATTPEGEKAAVKALIQLGLTHELSGDRDKAREEYEKGKKKFPKYAATFQAALDRLAATAPVKDGMSRLAPGDIEQILCAIVLLQGDGMPPEKKEKEAKDDTEAGVHFWKAINLAAASNYTEAIDEIKKARAAHIQQARGMLGRGLNPLSDPLEQIFPRCCDDLKAYWELRAGIYANKPVADLIKKEGVEKALDELQKKATQAVKLMTELTEATDKLTKAEKDLKDAKTLVVKLETDVKEAIDDKAAVAKLLEAEQTARKARDTLVESLAKELQTAKLLPEKYDAASLLAAQKLAADRATGPNLTTLVSPGMMAIGGSGLSSAQLIDIAERLSKAETVARAATDKLTVETRRLTTEHTAELKKLKESQAAEVKKLTDEYAADMKKLMETYATNTTKLKDEQAAELKKMTDKFTGDLKKLTEDNTVAVKKLTDGFEGKIKGLEAAVVKEKASGEAVAAKLQTELRNSVSPAQALDLWLPQLTELRRVADADPAIANANKVLASAGPDSEDAAKARTVIGLALLIKGELPLAKAMFYNARTSPAYKAAAGKEWVKVADLGMASIEDPLAPYRLPVANPKRDIKAAARALDTGITAYKAGRYAEAITALLESTRADPTDPLSWYFLGAARWAKGSVEQAREDYRQGAEWEKLSNTPTRIISDNLEPIQGAARDGLYLARP